MAWTLFSFCTSIDSDNVALVIPQLFQRLVMLLLCLSPFKKIQMGNYLIGNRTSDVIHTINNCFLKLNPTIKYKWTNNQNVLFDNLQYDLIPVTYCCPFNIVLCLCGGYVGKYFLYPPLKEISNWGWLGKCSKSSSQQTHTNVHHHHLSLPFIALVVCFTLNEQKTCIHAELHSKETL